MFLLKDRVTKPQKKMLITLLRETKFMEGKKEKEWYWEKIQAALNSIGPKKTIIQWKKCWRDMRLTTRKKLAELKRCQLAGGSPPPGIELNQEDNDIIDIVGAEYFYEEMNGELKPENFLSTFDYAPEHFCDAILTAAGQQSAAAAAATHMQAQHVKDQQQQQQQQQQHNVHQQQQQQQAAPTEHHGNENEGNDSGAASSTHNEAHQTVFQTNVGSLNTHSEDQSVGLGIPANTHPNMSHHGASSLHGGLHSHLLRRQQQHQHVANAAFQRDSMFEEKLLQLMHDVFPKRSKKRNCRDPDKLFLLSLYDEMKRIPEELRLDVKSELIQVIKRYQKHSPLPIKQESTVAHVTHKPNLVNDNMPTQHAPKINAHNMYQMTSIAKREQEPPSPQAQHALDSNVTAVHVNQQLPHPLYQLQKKYDEVAVVDKQQQQQQQQQTQNEQQRKQSEAAAVAVAVHHQQQQQQQQQQHAPSAPNSNDPQVQQQQQQQAQTHMHHAQIPHGILFPLPPQQQQQQQQPPPPLAQQHTHNPHNPHQHQQQQQQQQQQQPPTHHTPTIFGGASAERPSMTYETVG